jgi:hypothetical protein
MATAELHHISITRPRPHRLHRLLCAGLNPRLLDLNGAGVHVAGQPVVTVDQIPTGSAEPAFAMLCNVAPIPASLGQTHCDRLDRADRQANAARTASSSADSAGDPAPARTSPEGPPKVQRHHPRCLKRLIAREIYYTPPLLDLPRSILGERPPRGCRHREFRPRTRATPARRFVTIRPPPPEL